MINRIQKKLIFQSNYLEEKYRFEFKSDFEEVYFNSEDGARLHGIYFKVKNPKGIILYLHGNARSLDYWGDWGEQLANTYQYNVLIPDYRGYGKSRGERNYLRMLNDACLFYKYCLKSFSENNIIVFGRSLGGSFASHVSKQFNPEKLIIESSFTTLKEVVKLKYKFIPVYRLLRYPFQNEENVPFIRSKTYFIHGTKDTLVPYSMGEKLLELSGSAEKELFTIKGGVHNNLRDFEAYFEALNQIL